MDVEELSSIIADVLDIDLETISLNSNFVTNLGADSLDIQQIVSEVEDRLQIQIPEDMLDEIVTVEDTLNAINASL